MPVSARIARVTGLNAAAGGLLTNVTINGDFAMQGDTILSDNLRIRSPQIDATAIVVADLSTGIYRGGLKGRVNDYQIEGVGIINLTTDIKLGHRAIGRVRAAGAVRRRSRCGSTMPARRISSAGAR